MKSVPMMFCSLLFVVVLASIASAQNNRSFVSGLGNDSNPCTLTSPCRSFTQAISQTNDGGEVVALDSAGYGPFTIDRRSVTVEAPAGVYAGISVFSGDGIDITNAGVVVLRGLTINSQSGSTVGGIAFTSGRALHVENCVINGFGQGLGIGFFFAGRLFVKDTISRDNLEGIGIVTPTGTAVATIDNVRLENNTFGLGISNNVLATISNSVASGNGTGMIAAPGSSPAELNIDNCLVANNSIVGISSQGQGSAVVRVSTCTVTDNGTGLGQSGNGALLSHGDNTVEGNTTDLSGTIGSFTSS